MKLWRCPSCGTKNKPHSYGCSNCGEVFRASKEKYNQYLEKEQEINNKLLKEKSEEKTKDNNIKNKTTKKEKAEKIIKNTGNFAGGLGILKIAIGCMILILNISGNSESSYALIKTIDTGYFSLFITILVGTIYLIFGNRIQKYHNKKIIGSLITVMIISIFFGLITILTNPNNGIQILLSIRLGILCIRSLFRIKYTNKTIK